MAVVDPHEAVASRLAFCRLMSFEGENYEAGRT